MTQTQNLPGVVLQWKAMGPFNQAPTATVSVRPHFPFADGAGSSNVLVFPSDNTWWSFGSFFPTPLIGSFDALGRLVGPDGYPLAVPALDMLSNRFYWLQCPTFYEIQIDIEGMSAQKGIFVAFREGNACQALGTGATTTQDQNASISDMTDNGEGGYSGTVYFSDTVVHPILVDCSLAITVGGSPSVFEVNSIDLVTNSASVTTNSPLSAASSDVQVNWGNQESGNNLAVDLSQYVNWL